MKMIGQYDKGVDREWKIEPCRGDGLAQGHDVVDQQSLPPLQQIDSEEPAATRNKGATIIRHAVSLAGSARPGKRQMPLSDQCCHNVAAGLRLRQIRRTRSGIRRQFAKYPDYNARRRITPSANPPYRLGLTLPKSSSPRP